MGMMWVHDMKLGYEVTGGDEATDGYKVTNRGEVTEIVMRQQR
jgi:hypothetical protein